MAFPEGVRLRALIGDQARCRHCGVSQHDARMEVHHIVPEVGGGNDRLTNAVTLCVDCHYETHGHMWTEQTPISETDIDPEVVEETLNDSRTVIEEYNDKIAELKSQNSTLEALYGIEADRREQLETRRTDLHEKNTALTEDVKRLRETRERLRATVERLGGRDSIEAEELERLRREHQRLVAALWQIATPPVTPDDDTENKQQPTGLVSRLFSRLGLKHE